jgi:hypothetical protein
MRQIFINPETKRVEVVTVEAHWKHSGLPFTEDSFWFPVDLEETLDTGSEDEEEEGEQ